MKTTTKTMLALFATVAAVGILAATSGVVILPQVHAESCNQHDNGQSVVGCHGCQFNDNGYQKSGGKCHHHEN